MKIRGQEIMSQLKTNLDLGMQILLTLKNMELEITEEVVDNQQEKQLPELQQELLQKKY